MAKKKKSKTPKLWIPKSMCKASDLDAPGTVEDLATIAVDENPMNAPAFQVPMDGVIAPQFVAVMTSKWWRSEKKLFTFAFMRSVSSAVADRIAAFANIWNKYSALSFAWTNDRAAADFRIDFKADGYWSYMGTDCKSIPANQNTMNLQGMNSTTFSEREGMRVIPHEFGHAIGMPHEHTRSAIVARLDPQKTIAVFRRDQGWNEQTVRAQILTPIAESALHAATAPDESSIMCYWFTGECTKDGRPIVGGSTLSDLDKQYAAKIWPKTDVPPIEPPAAGKVMVWIDGNRYRVVEEAA